MKHFSKILTAALLCLMVCLPAGAQKTQGTFEAGKGTFLLNGKPFIVKAAEIHYPRIPKPYWEHRIKMCKALGMNTICIYIFWNLHEQQEGVFDFSGDKDVAEFCRLAQKNGMYVIVRPGPYVCAEWEMGGLPWWLLKKKDIALREQDPYFMERVRLFETEVGKQLAPLTIQKGGPIIMVQVENEYGSYGKNKPYVSEIRNTLREVGFKDVTLFQCDWSSNFLNNGLDDLVWTMNFGTGANIDQQFKKLREVRPDAPLMCSEFWSGWFDKWGARHETRPSKDMVAGMDEMLSKGISFSLYMTHGGTSFGHWAGANSPGFAPDVTSYDYDAPITEYGTVTPKFDELRQMMQRYSDKKLPAAPAPKPIVTVPAFNFTEYAPLFANLPAPIETNAQKTMEEFDQGWGSIIYRTTLPQTDGVSTLHIENGHDYVQVFIDGRYVGKLDRRLGEQDITLPALRKGAQLDLLVEAMGRINFGRAIKDFKGIDGTTDLTIKIDGNDYTAHLYRWQNFLLPDTYEFTAKRKFDALQTPDFTGKERVPGFYRACVKINKVGDTFLNFETFGKGLVYVNGHALGRIWEIGPQQTLYVPGCWLKKGENEIVVFDVIGPKIARSEGLAKPIIDKLGGERRLTHRKKGQNLNLDAAEVVAEGTFREGGGWQDVKFGRTVTTRYICLEALNAFNPNDLRTCIAELYVLDGKGERLSREPWKVVYADSEEVTSGNYAADKTFDLQESTYWSTAQKAKFPHHLVIDLGAECTISAMQYLPRMESSVPGAVKDYRIYTIKDIKKAF